MTSVAAIFSTTLPTLKMFIVCWDNFGSNHPEQVCEIFDIFKGNTTVVKPSIVFAVHINFTSLLNVVGGMSGVGVWVGGWFEPTFCMGRTGLVDPQHFSVGKKKGGIEILVWVKHVILWTFIMILRSFICDSSLLSGFSAHISDYGNNNFIVDTKRDRYIFYFLNLFNFLWSQEKPFPLK